MTAQKRIKVGVVGAPHGIKGEVRVKSYTQPLDNIVSYAPLFDEGGCAFEIASYRKQKSILILKFVGVDTRDSAEAIKNKTLFVDRKQLGDTSEEEYYYIDLIGLTVFADEGFTERSVDSRPLGHVSYVDNFGAGDLLEITLRRGSKIFVPFTSWMVPRLSITNQYLTLASEGLALDTKDKALNLLNE